MSPAQKSKTILAAGVVFTTAFVMYTTVYLPFYSPEIDELKSKGAQQPRQNSKSMWANMDREIKDHKKD